MSASDPCIHELFLSRAESSEERDAVTDGAQVMTYRKLSASARGLAGRLQEMGAGRGGVVAVHLAPSSRSVAAVLAVLLAGAAYLPIDAEYPEDRVRFMLEDSRADLLITDRGDGDQPLGRLPEVRIRSDQDLDAMAAGATYRAPASEPSDLAYIIYTSGSTGVPKGVEVEHRNVTRLFTKTNPWFQFSSRDVWTLFHSLAFDFSVWEMWGALLHGGRLVVVPRAVARSTADFLTLLREEKVTILSQTPSAFAELIRVESRDVGPTALCLRRVILGGEALRPAMLAGWFERHGDDAPQVINMYGITETTVHVTYRRVVTSDTQHSASVIGRPIPDLQVYLVEQQTSPLRQVPPGEVGEMYVAGAGVARGYRGRPRLTKERFLPNPFEGPGKTLYRSGDLARINADGELEYVGRADRQLKVRGYRIEPGEVESALVKYPGIQEASVLPTTDSDGVSSLVAYVVSAEPGQPVATARVRDHLRLHLPRFMVPETIVELERLPRTANGKVDKDALVALASRRSSDSAAYVAPLTPLEEQMAAIWEELLGVDPVGTEDDFFDLGGHSLLAVRMTRQVGLALGRDVPVTLLYEHHTIKGLATALAATEGDAQRAPVTAIRATGSRPPLFFLHGDHQGGGFYCLNLGRKIAPDQPVYGLQPHGIDNLPVPATIEEMAAYYLPLIREIQPSGPYHLVGYRPASYVALELAQQLKAAGEEVRMVAMIDPGRPRRRILLAHAVIAGLARPLRIGTRRQVEWFLWVLGLFHRVQELRGYTLGRAGGAAPLEGEDPAVIRLRQAVQSRRRVVAPQGPGRARGLDLAGEERDLSRWARAERHEDQFGRYSWATAAYHPRPYAGRVVMFWSRDAAEVPATAPKTVAWWRRSLSDVESHYVPGDHASSITRYADVLAAELRRCLDHG